MFPKRTIKLREANIVNVSNPDSKGQKGRLITQTLPLFSIPVLYSVEKIQGVPANLDFCYNLKLK